MQGKDLFVLENLDNILRFELFHTIADYIDDHKVKSEKDISVNYVNDFLDYFISFTEHFYDIKPLVEEKLFNEFKTSKFNNYYFAYGSNIDPKQMQERCPVLFLLELETCHFIKLSLIQGGGDNY